MKDIIHKLAGHIEAVAGVSPQVKPEPDALRKLPRYLGSLYEAWSADLMDDRYLLLVFKGQERPTPAEVAGHLQVVLREISEPVAFVFSDMASFERQRLMQYHVPFVVPRRQMYLPKFAIDIREGSSSRGLQPDQPRHLSGAAQALLLYYLQKPKAGDAYSLSDWSKVLGYSAMTMTRVAGELEAAQLCEAAQSRRSIVLAFDRDHRALWEKALPSLRSPVRGFSHARLSAKKSLPWLRAGFSALSSYSMLADDGRAVFAVGPSEYARALVDGDVEELRFPDEGAATVERWRYRPEILSSGPAVDRLSLYLELREDHNERVQSALASLLEGVPW